MKIDLFTLIAQMINFLILVFFLYKVLFKKILKVMDERKTIVESKLNDALEKEKKAETEKKDYIQKKADLENSKNEILNKAKKEAIIEKQNFLKKAQEEINDLKIKWQENVTNQQKDFLENLKKDIVNKFVNFSNKAILELSSLSLENAIIDHFLEEIQKEKINKDSKKYIY